MFLLACTEDGSDLKQQEVTIDLSHLKFNLESLDLKKPQMVYEYQNKTELKEKTAQFMTAIFEEIDGLIQSNSKITNVLFQLEFAKGIATLKEVYVLDGKNEVVISGPVGRTDWDALFNGARCPQGWDDNGSCSSASCVATTTQEILTDPDAGINSSGDCTQIQFNRGLLSVRICSRGCS
jgi:hypothetical protein